MMENNCKLFIQLDATDDIINNYPDKLQQHNFEKEYVKILQHVKI